MANTNRTLLYLGAAACTGIAGILHLMFVPTLDCCWCSIHCVLFDFWFGTALLGFTNGKKMGQDLEYCRISWYGCISGFNWLRSH